MAESQSVEEKVVNAFMADIAPPSETQQANPATEAPEQAETDTPQADEASANAKQEAQSDAQGDVETIEIDPDEPLFEQELPDDDGKKVAQKLSLKELQQGYLRERDYRRKTQELARQREELPKQIAKQAQEVSSSYEKRLSELNALVVKTVAAELSGKDLNQLATEDPFEYVRISNRARQLNETLQAIQKEQEAESAKRKQDEEKSASEKWAKTLEGLQRDIPDFGEPLVKRLLEVGKEWGFAGNELTDGRVIKMLHALSDKKSVETKRPEVEKKVAVVTKMVKPGQPSKTPNKIQEARAKLRKSGKPEDALSIFEAFS